MSWRIRQAAYEDLEAAAWTKARAWNESLVGVVPDEALRRQLDPERVARTVAYWQAAMERGGYVWIVVDDDGELAGVAHACVGDDVDAPTPLELQVIYLVAAAQGSGIADALLQVAIGDAPAFLWVLTGNDRAQAFYTRHGFAPDGTTCWIEGLNTTKERWVRGA